MSHITIRKFTAQDFPIYKKWFSDQTLQETLGHVDDEWLNHILKDQEGYEFVILDNQKLVAVIGVVLPTQKNPITVITNIAVDPKEKGKGYGTIALQKVMEEIGTTAGGIWAAYVSQNNVEGQHFFDKQKWIKISTNDKEEFVRYEYRIP